MTVRLYDIAHARAGDKGNLNTIALIPYDPDQYDLLRAQLTADRVRAGLGARITGTVTRYELGTLPGLLFVCHRDPDDTVTASPHLDGHGKSLSSALLELTIPGRTPV